MGVDKKEVTDVERPGRRRFLRNSPALAGIALGPRGFTPTLEQDAATREMNPAGFRPYGERSEFERSLRTMLPGPAGLTPLQDFHGIITPSALHYVFNHYGVPHIDPQQHRVLIHGMVERELLYTMDDLRRLPSVSRVHFIECGTNSSGALKGAQTVIAHGLTSCAEWTGVLLSVLLKAAGVRRGASWVVVEGADAGKHSKSLPLAKAMDDILLAYGQNGEALRPENGYPLRLVVPGFEGVGNVKWVRRIKVTNQPYMQKAESAGYANVRLTGKVRWFQFELGPKSVITRPSGGQKLPGTGFYEVSGLAWSGGGAVSKVEISTENGTSWKNAILQEPVHRYAHTRFRFNWDWDGRETVLLSRCTDEAGQVQPTLRQMSHAYGVGLDYWKTTTNLFNHINFIQPWKIGRDGSVSNALL